MLKVPDCRIRGGTWLPWVLSLAALPAWSSEPIVVDGTATEFTCSGTTCGETNTYNPGFGGCVMAFGSSVPTPGPDRLVTVIRPPRSVLDLRLHPLDGWDPALYVTTTSDADSIALIRTACIAGVDSGFDGSSEVISGLENVGETPDTLYVIVDSALPSGALSCGAFDLDLSFRPLSGDTCDDAPAITLGAEETVVLSGVTCVHGDGVSPAMCGHGLPAGGVPGRDATVAVTVNPVGAWWLTLTPESAWDASLVISIDCDDPDAGCVSVGETGGIGTTEALRRVNLAENTTYYVTVDSPLGAGATDGCGGYVLELTTDTDGTPIQGVRWGELKNRFR